MTYNCLVFYGVAIVVPICLCWPTALPGQWAADREEEFTSACNSGSHSDHLWQVGTPEYDSGYVDKETDRVEPSPSPRVRSIQP